MSTTTNYSLTTWADGFGIWNCRIDFTDGAGNTGEGQRLASNARRAAQRLIRRNIQERQTSRLRPLRYTVVANRENPSTGALMSLTIQEA